MFPDRPSAQLQATPLAVAVLTRHAHQGVEFAARLVYGPLDSWRPLPGTRGRPMCAAACQRLFLPQESKERRRSASPGGCFGMAADVRRGGLAKEVPARYHGSVGDRPLASGDGAGSEPEHRTSIEASRRGLRSYAVPFAVFLLAALYLLFVWTYAVDVPRDDDGGTVLLVHSALHGQFSFRYFWGQHLESRIFVLNLIFLAVGYLDHLDLRTVMFLSALLLIGAFLLLLRLFRVYLDRPLTALPVLLVGFVWFSLIDVTNALWAISGRLVCGPVLPDRHSVSAPGISLASILECRVGNPRRGGRDFFSPPRSDRLARGTLPLALGDSLGTKNAH